MGLLKKFFRREEPFLIQFSLLTIIGFWHLNSPKKWMRQLYAVYRFFAVLSLTTLLFTELIDVIMIGEDSSKVAERLCAASITCIFTTRTHLTLRYTERFYDLQEKLNEFRRMRSDRPKDLEVMNEAADLIVKAAKLFLTGGMTACLFWTAHPILYEDRKLPFPIRVPVDIEKSPYYELLYLYLTLVLITFTVSVLAAVLGFGSYLTIINSHFDVVKRNLESISDEREEVAREERFLAEFNTGRFAQAKSQQEREAEEKERKDAKTMDILRDAIQTLTFIYEEVDEFKKLHSEYLLVHIVGIVFGIAVVETSGLTDDFTIHFLKRLLIVGLGTMDIFSVCLFGEELQQKSCEVAEALYIVPWHEMGTKVQKVMLIMSIRSRRPCVIKAGGTIGIHFATFLNVMRVAYNFMLLLRHTVNS